MLLAVPALIAGNAVVVKPSEVVPLSSGAVTTCLMDGLNEADIEAYSTMKEFPIIPCNLCGSQENLQRQVVKEMLQEWERKSPGRTEIMFRALQNVVPSQLADRNLFDFKSLRIDDSATPRFVDVMSL